MNKNRCGSGRNMEMRARGLQKPVHRVLFCSVLSATTFTQAMKRKEQERDRVGEESCLSKSRLRLSQTQTPGFSSSWGGKAAQLGEQIWSWRRDGKHTFFLLASVQGNATQHQGCPWGLAQHLWWNLWRTYPPTTATQGPIRQKNQTYFLNGGSEVTL